MSAEGAPESSRRADTPRKLDEPPGATRWHYDLKAARSMESDEKSGFLPRWNRSCAFLGNTSVRRAERACTANVWC
jgi:hypothetical protein